MQRTTCRYVEWMSAYTRDCDFFNESKSCEKYKIDRLILFIFIRNINSNLNNF